MNGRDLQLSGIIKNQYRSFEKPDYSFVSKVASSKPYQGLVQQLQELFVTEEITDLNDDVSFRYLLSKSEKQWVVELSMIGSYATILRVNDLSLPEVVSLSSLVKEEKSIYCLLVNHQLELLKQSELEKPFPLQLWNTECDEVCLYHVLFSDTGTLPWRE